LAGHLDGLRVGDFVVEAVDVLGVSDDLGVMRAQLGRADRVACRVSGHHGWGSIRQPQAQSSP
jgi:hypothetical protein